MKIGMKEDMGVANNDFVKFGIACAQRAQQHRLKHSYMQILILTEAHRCLVLRLFSVLCRLRALSSLLVPDCSSEFRHYDGTFGGKSPTLPISSFWEDCNENHMKEDMGVVNEMTSSTIKLGHEFAVFRQKVVA